VREFYLNAIAGRRRDPAAILLRGALAACEPPYAFAVAARNTCYDRGWLPVYRAAAPVISVGNITTGGTGKTPTVAWVVEWLRSHGRAPAILSRGYHSLDGRQNDEKLLLDQLCPGVPHVQGPDRVASARQAIETFGSNVLVLDDGFQHRRLHRDLDLVLIDALNPWGHGRLLPRGLLREPRSALRRAALVVITRADQCDADQLAALRREIGHSTPAGIAESAFVPRGLINTAGDRSSFEALRNKQVAAFCGIGNPQGFRSTLASAGLALRDDQFRTFPDHHHYSAADLAELGAWAGTLGAEALVTTRKDLVKVPQDSIRERPLWAVDIELAFRTGADFVVGKLNALIRAH
jgi:tetraacyldisaccharide 4'-kinase